MQAEPSAAQTLQVQDDKPAPEKKTSIIKPVSTTQKNVMATVVKQDNCGCCKSG
jgi:hypothetical protein